MSYIGNQPSIQASAFPMQQTGVDANITPFNSYYVTANVTLTLPPIPNVDDVIEIIAVSDCTLDTGSVLINGGTGPLNVDLAPVSFKIQYANPTLGWVVI